MNELIFMIHDLPVTVAYSVALCSHSSLISAVQKRNMYPPPVCLLIEAGVDKLKYASLV